MPEKKNLDQLNIKPANSVYEQLLKRDANSVYEQLSKPAANSIYEQLSKPAANSIYEQLAKPSLEEQTTDAEKNNDVSVISSVLSGIGSGLIDIPKGLFSLGASIYDLTNDTKTAVEIEKWFDDLTTLDEKAKATTAGKIVKTLTNLAVPGGIAFKAGSRLANAAVNSKKAGNYFKLSNPNLLKAGEKAGELNTKGKVARFMGGATAGGLAESVFVGDVEEAGTFGDLLGGPTELKRDKEYDPERELINRVKFGTEGALFTGVIGGIGQTLKKLATRGKELRFSNNQIDRILDKGASKLRARAGKTQEFFDIERGQIGARAADVNFAQQVSRNLDKNIDAIFPPLKTVFNKQTSSVRNKTLDELNEVLLSGKPVINKSGAVIFGNVDQTLKNNVVKTLQKAGAKQENIDAIFNNIDSMRTGWSEMFSALGSKLDDQSLKEFKDLFGSKFKGYLGSTYELFQNKSLLPFLNYKPSEEVVQKTAEMFKKVARQNGTKLTDEQANYYVDRLVKTARLPKGFKLDKPSDPIFQIPDFFVGKTVLDDSVTARGYTSLSALPKENRQIIEELFGRQKNPIQTILSGTGRLSLVTRRNEFFQDIAMKSNELVKSGKRGMVYETEEEALRFLGPDIKKIDIDPGKTLEAGITNPLNGKWAIKEVADALEETAASTRSDSMVGKLYEGLVLYPKATSQIAKTILSPFTHARNFISAGAFATANGIIPTPKAIKESLGALQVGLKDTVQQNELYRKLLKLGVVNSNVRLGDLRKLLEDVNFGETLTSDKGLRMLLKPLSKIKKTAEDLYTAEDDFWKITSWAMERDRLGKAYAKYGIKRTAQQLEEEAASIVRNNIPNYDYVSDFVKGLRKLPIGNFVSFPAEIMRTGTNIVKRALDEIGYEVTLANGKKVKPLAGIGYKRLVGMAATTAAVPVAAVETAKAIYDVTEDEMKALRRYVADWSKNSTLIPIRDKKTKQLKYIDFSHTNAYDTLAKPFQSVINAVAEGEKDKNGMMDDFMRGLFTATKEIASPFISESIWTEAAGDIILRKGVTRNGKQVWNEEDTDGNKVRKMVDHLVKSQAPLNWQQLKRLDLAIKPVDILVKGKYDEYAQTYELGDELAGLAGMRVVQVDPERTFKFKIADYQRGVRDSRKLFVGPTLKGGPITPKEIVDAYINANRALFNVNKNLYEDIKAARTLKLPEETIVKQMKDRASIKTYAAMDSGAFRPLNISKEVMKVFQENADKMKVRNPFFDAVDYLSKIKSDLYELPLSAIKFPEIINPFDNLPEPQVPNIQGQLPQLPSVSPQLGQQFGQIPNQGLTQSELALLSPSEQAIRLKQKGIA